MIMNWGIYDKKVSAIDKFKNYFKDLIKTPGEPPTE